MKKIVSIFLFIITSAVLLAGIESRLQPSGYDCYCTARPGEICYLEDGMISVKSRDDYKNVFFPTFDLVCKSPKTIMIKKVSMGLFFEKKTSTRESQQ